jgi:hypothetical protein
LILWLNGLWNWLWWCWWSDRQVIAGSLESAEEEKCIDYAKRKTFTLWIVCGLRFYCMYGNYFCGLLSDCSWVMAL